MQDVMHNPKKNRVHFLRVSIYAMILVGFNVGIVVCRSPHTPIADRVGSSVLDQFKSCLDRINVDISYPSNETWWYDSQSIVVTVLKHPIAVAYAQSTSDVQELVKCATKHKIKVNPRSGGHSYTAFCNEDNHFVIDVSQIAFVDISDDGQTAEVGAGIRVGPLTYELAKRKRVFPCAPEMSIGLGGHVAAGGVGLLTRLWGISADNVLELEMVDYRGEILVANNGTNDDLFFALRGGGGGSYGIVTRMKLRIYPYPVLSTAFTITWGQSMNTSDFSKTFFKWKPWDSMPREMGFYMCMYHSHYQMGGLYLREDGHEGLEKILNESGILEVGPAGSQMYKYYSSEDMLEVTAWLLNGRVHYGNASDYQVFNVPTSFGYKSLDLPPYPNPVPPTYVEIQKDPRVNATHADNSVGRVGPILDQKPMLVKRKYVLRTNQLLTKEYNETACDAIDEYLHQGLGDVLFVPGGGFIRTLPEDFNAFPHRNSIIGLEFQTIYYPAGTHIASGVDGQLNSTNKILAAMEPFTNHRSYQGVPNMFWTTDPKVYMQRYYGGNVKRLIRAKAAYDPQDVFSNAQSTPIN